MAYAVKQDIIDRYGEEFLQTVADRDEDFELDDTAITKELDDAFGWINTYISARYDLPIVAPIPEILVALNVDIAVYRICQTWDNLTDEKRRRFEDAVALLKDIAAGDAGLGLDVPPATVGGGATIQSEDRIFTRTLMRGL